MIYKSLHEMVLDYVSCKPEKEEPEYHSWNSENMNSMFQKRAPTNTNIALAVASPFIGGGFLVT